MILEKEIDKITLSDLEVLIEAGTPEGPRLEFKREHYARNDKGRKEFAADVSAMANSSGGLLIIGIEERHGCAHVLSPIDSDDPDKLVLAVSESIRNSIEPSIAGITVRWLETSATHGLLFLQIPKSWQAPHRVTVAKDRHFYVRDENGKHPMSVDELRRSFLYAQSLEDRIRAFRKERLALIDDGQGNLYLGDEMQPTLVVHILPQSAFTQNSRFDLETGVPIAPISASGWDHVYCIDGKVSYVGQNPEDGSTHAYTTAFYNGCVEAVVRLHVGENDGIKLVSASEISKYVGLALKGALRFFSEQNIMPPLYVMATVNNINGYHSTRDNGYFQTASHPIRRRTLEFPELVIRDDQMEMETIEILKPLANMILAAFGQVPS